MQPLELQVGQSKATNTLPNRLQIYFPKKTDDVQFGGQKLQVMILNGCPEQKYNDLKAINH